MTIKKKNERLTFFLGLRTSQGCPLLLLSFNIISEVLSYCNKEESECYINWKEKNNTVFICK